MNFLIVALGGAVGSIFRYSISLIPIKTTFPFLTLITNILGAVLIGFIVGVSSKKGLSSNTNLFLKTGVCGGFTTFSTFSNDTYMCLADFDSYVDRQSDVAKAFEDKELWGRMSLVNTANAGMFSADRSVEEYVKDIWNIKKVK